LSGRQTMKGRALVALTVLAACFSSHAAEFAGVFGDHMVLQRDYPIAIWGTAAPGQSVTVTISNAVRTAETDASGRWKVVAHGAGSYSASIGTVRASLANSAAGAIAPFRRGKPQPTPAAHSS